MLRTQALADSQQSPIDGLTVDAAEGSKHLAKFKADEAICIRGKVTVGIDNCIIRLLCQPKGLKDDGCPTR